MEKGGVESFRKEECRRILEDKMGVEEESLWQK